MINQEASPSPYQTTFPMTWYQVAWSYELPRSRVKAVKLGCKDLVIFRGEDGHVYALDAYCVHLGAHLAIKGSVCQNRIRCAFHGWEFDGDGKCQKLSQNAKITPNMHTRSWRVTERYGIIFVFYNPHNLEVDIPFQGVEALDSGTFGHPIGRSYDITTRHSDVLENGVDMQHFSSVHNVPMHDPKLNHEPNGNLVFLHQTVTKRLGIPFDTLMKIIYINPGLQIIYLQNVLGRECIMLSSVTPIDKGMVRAHLTTHLKKMKFSPSFITTAFTQAISYFIGSTFAQDIPIWNAKVYKAKPVLAKGDEGIYQFRNWYNQFPVATV